MIVINSGLTFRVTATWKMKDVKSFCWFFFPWSFIQWNTLALWKGGLVPSSQSCHRNHNIGQQISVSSWFSTRWWAARKQCSAGTPNGTAQHSIHSPFGGPLLGPAISCFVLQSWGLQQTYCALLFHRPRFLLRSELLCHRQGVIV